MRTQGRFGCARVYVEHTQAGRGGLEECLVGETASVPVNHHRMSRRQFLRARHVAGRGTAGRRIVEITELHEY